MKLLASLLLAATMVLCGNNTENVNTATTVQTESRVGTTSTATEKPTPELTPQVEAWEALKEFILQNGKGRKEYNDVIYTQTNADETLGDVSLIYKNETDQIVIASTLFQQDNNIWTAYSVSFTLINNSDECKYLTQLAYPNAKAENNMSQYKVNSEISKNTVLANTVFDLSSPTDDSNIGIPKDYEIVFTNRLHSLLTFFNNQLEELGLTLPQFGFTSYESNTTERTPMEIPGLKEELLRVEPAPIEIVRMKIKNNSIGTPEAYIQFKNIADKKIIFDFYVACYDAYGDLVLGYNRYTVYSGAYEDWVDSGKTTPSDWRWTLYGFDLTKTIKVAICKYKLDGEPAVIIPEDQLVWVSMD